MGRLSRVASVTLAVSLILSGCGTAPTVVGTTRVPADVPSRTALPTTDPPIPIPTVVLPTRTPAGSPAPAEGAQEPVSPYDLISQESILGYLEALTNIQAYSGWRNSATEGEAEALDFAADTLNGMATLQSWGLELERQTFHVFSATEMWETRLMFPIVFQSLEKKDNQ